MITDQVIPVVNDGYYAQTFNREGDTYSGGYFMMLDDNSRIIHLCTCRENFASFLKPEIKRIAWHSKNLGEEGIKKVNQFFMRREAKLRKAGIEIQEIVIYKTDIPNFIVLEIDPFWMQNIITQAIFTLFLRCAAIFYPKTAHGGNFEEALQAYPLAAQVVPAIMFFLEGNIHPTKMAFDPNTMGITGARFVSRFSNVIINCANRDRLPEIFSAFLSKTTDQ